MDKAQPPYQNIAASSLLQTAEPADPDSEIRLLVKGPDFDSGKMKQTTLLLTAAQKDAESLADYGLNAYTEDGLIKLEEPLVGTPFYDSLSGLDFYGDDSVYIVSAQKLTRQMPKELIFIPALLLLVLIVWLQSKRARLPQARIA